MPVPVVPFVDELVDKVAEVVGDVLGSGAETALDAADRASALADPMFDPPPAELIDSPKPDSDNLRFAGSGGCDCGYSPTSCGAGWACRWQY